MSLLEGFGDYIMDEVGRDLVPDVERISARFHARRDRRTGFERAMMRVTGMDLKMEQYRMGEEFVAAIARARGAEALRKLWLGPETLPTPEEIDLPSRWIGTSDARAHRRRRLAQGTHMNAETTRNSRPGAWTGRLAIRHRHKPRSHRSRRLRVDAGEDPRGRARERG